MKTSLRKSDIRKLNEDIKKWHQFDSQIRPKDRIELVDSKIVLVNNRPAWFYHDNRILPTLITLLEYNFLPKMTVDMGAVRFVTKGADVFRPGVVNLDSTVKVDDYVCVVDEKHGKPLAIAKSLISFESFSNTKTGKVATIVHYVGDPIWEMMSSL